LSEYNFYFGIGGQISYDIKALKDFVKKAPLSHLVLETDAPWLTPTSRKEENEKTTNEPAFLVDVLEELAKPLKMDSTALEDILLQNTLRLFPAFSEIVDNQEGYGV
jgi:TatD DNase family protein